MEVISRSQDRLSPEYSGMLFKRHLQGALVRSGASLIMGLFAILAFYTASIKFHHLAGVGVSILFLILINPPTLWVLTKIKSRLVYRYFSLLINFLEIIGYTAIIYFLGGIEATYLTPIYAALITYVGVVSPRSFPFLVAALCGLAFSSMVTLEYLGYLPHQRVLSDFYPPLAIQAIFVSVAMGLFFVTAYISAFTAGTLKTIRQELRWKNIELQSAVRRMEDAERELIIAHGELEKRIEKRTKDLANVNKELVAEISERKQVEEMMRESEARHRLHFENVTDVIFSIDTEFRAIDVSPSVENILGYRPDEMIGLPFPDLNILAPEYLTTALFNAKSVLAGEKIASAVYEFIAKDGSRKIGEVSGSPLIKQGKIIGLISVARDITEKRKLEDQLQQASKMEAIATLAGGVAHEFNNALMGILGNIELLKIDLPENERRAKYFEAMKDSGHRMSRLTDQLLAYSEGGKYEPKNLKLNDFAIETLPILQHDLSPEVRVETYFPKDVSYIEADYTQMQMLLSAILANSNEAIEDEGLIKVTAGNEELDEDFTKQHPGLKPGSYVGLTIEDDGEGMDEETTNRIFEPFFTTKFQGRGMGMAAVYGIVKNHDGWIFVGSELGKGTVVRIYLPAVEVVEEVEKGVVLRPTVELAMGEGTILVIEDEETLVEMFRQILEILGYRVLEARTGKQAVELAKTFDGQIDLALLDIKLPDMDGGRVYPLIMEARPDLKVIVCSGYSIDGPAQAILDAGAEGFIQKPFSLSPFAEKIKEVLEGT